MKNFWEENWFFVMGAVIGSVISFFLLSYLNSISETVPFVEPMLLVILMVGLVGVLRLNEVSWKNIAIGSLMILLMSTREWPR